ncbi:putative fucosyltransferase [Thermostichus vulcanus NIES-2134]|nr:putative fucosyltransferase [Thermostichus vulcanus NIES-2134]
MAICESGALPSHVGALSYSGGAASSFFGRRNADGLNDKWLALRDAFRAAGGDLLAIEDARSAALDFVIHVNAHRLRHDVPAFVILAESEFIHPPNVDWRMLQQYKGIFTWMPDLVRRGIGTEICLAHPLGAGVVDGYQERPQLLVMIASNKALPVWRPAVDLYRERVRAIRWFEKHAPQAFALYGHDWDKSPRLPTPLGGIVHGVEFVLPWRLQWFPSWKGVIPSKREVLRHARFSLCYENVRGLRGYITEKIFDAFCAGNVPVYWGAEDITDYIPADCFIDRRAFGDYADLYRYLTSMPETRYIQYQQAICDFLVSPAAKRFSSEIFVTTIVGKVLDTLGRRDE